MGTNFYLIDSETEEELLHIGKSSGGWCFSLHVYPTGAKESNYYPRHSRGDTYPIDEPIHNLSDWKKLFYNDKYKIRDEYSDIISPDEMVSIITDRARADGEYQLRRHEVDDKYCIGNAYGTYDFLVGDFS